MSDATPKRDAYQIECKRIAHEFYHGKLVVDGKAFQLVVRRQQELSWCAYLYLDGKLEIDTKHWLHPEWAAEELIESTEGWFDFDLIVTLEGATPNPTSGVTSRGGD